jgi:hypothetical protein
MSLLFRTIHKDAPYGFIEAVPLSTRLPLFPARIVMAANDCHFSVDITTYEVMCATPGSSVRQSAWKIS